MSEKKDMSQISKWVVNLRSGKHFDVYIGRINKSDPGEWGNKYVIGVDGTREECIEKHKRDILRNPSMIRKIRKELKGMILGCFCDPLPCHGHTLAKIANEDDIDRDWLKGI